MDKRRSCANCGSADHHVADCTTYKQSMKSLGYAPDYDHMSQMEEHEFYSGLIIKIGARCFFCNQEGHFRIDCPLFFLGSSQQPESPQAQVGVGGGAEPEKQTN